MTLYIPIIVIVLSNVFYHICAKLAPARANTFAALTITYLVGAVVSAVLYFFSNNGGNLLVEYRNINWSTWVMGIAIIGLEAGYVYLYRSGWDISIAQLVCSSLLAICLIVVGLVFFREHLTTNKIIGIIICMIGLFFINK